MKNKFFLLSILFIFTFCSCSANKSPQIVNRIDLGSSEGFTDCQFSDVVRIGDDVYINYYGDTDNTGIYKINNTSAEFIKKDKVDWTAMGTTNLDKLISYNGKLLREVNEYRYAAQGLVEIDTNSGKMESIIDYSKLKLGDSFGCIGAYNDKLYFVDDNREYKSVKKIYEYDGKELKVAFDFASEVKAYFIVKNTVYWIETKTSALYKADLTEKKKSLVKHIGYKYIDRFIVDEKSNYAYICYSEKKVDYKTLEDGAYYSVVCVELNNDKTFEMINDNTNERITFDFSANIMKCYNGKLYLGDEDKLYIFDPKKSKTDIINIGSIKNIRAIKDINILDSNYLYLYCQTTFAIHHVLYRISLDGNKLESVFG